MTGSEGLLGVVVEVVVRLLPVPTDTAVLVAGFHTVREAGDAVSSLIAQGVLPAGLEMMDALAIQAAEKILQTNLDAPSQRRLVENFIDDLPKN